MNEDFKTGMTLVAGLLLLVLSAVLSVRNAVADEYEPYLKYNLETENDEIQNRFELGIVRSTPVALKNARVVPRLFIYHESDPRNGLNGHGWPGETENGWGISLEIRND